MKKALLALAVAAIASTASAQIAGSKHDLTPGYTSNGVANASNPNFGSCQFCHAPHYGNVTSPGPTGTYVDGYSQIPLWNRRTPDDSSYSLYTNVSVTASPDLGVGSYTCLSCHDGTADMGATFRGGSRGFVNTPVQMTDTGAGRFANVAGTFDGTDYVADNTNVNLTDDHPVGIFYPAGGVGTDYVAVATVNGAGYGIKLYTRGAGGYSVECGSCHEPHESGVSKFLRTTGNLCGKCHTK